MGTVLIFAHECAPYNRPESTIGAQRAAQFARHLPKFGWRAIVLCCDASRRGQGWSSSDAVQVRTLVSESPPGESVVVPLPSMPMGLLDHAFSLASTNTSDSRGVGQIVRRALTAGSFLVGDYSRSWRPCAERAAAIVRELTDIDLVIAEHSPDASIFLARGFSRKYNVPWIADFRDPMLVGYQPTARRFLEPLARVALRSSSCIVNVTPGWVELDRALFRRPVAFIPNGYDPDDFCLDRVNPSPIFTIAYLGGIWVPESFDVFVAGLQLAQSRRTDGANPVRFLYRGGDAQWVRERISGVRNLVIDVQERVLRSDALAAMSASDLLLLLVRSADVNDDPYYMTGHYPGKTFEYFGAKRPILSVPGDGAELDALIADARAGSTCSSIDEVADVLTGAIGAYEEQGSLPFEPREEVYARYTRQASAQKLATLMDVVLASADRDRR